MIQKLTKNQIEEIYTFTQKHYVEWYDVQTELVDHLANGIEKQWETNSKISFNDALITEFKKFGIFGFQDLIEQKTKALNKIYRKEVWLAFKGFFRLPKIILTLFSIWTIYKLLHVLNSKMYLMIAFVAVVFIFTVFHLIKIKNSIEQRKKLTGKKWLFESSIIQLGEIIHFLNLGIWFHPIFKPDKQWTSTSEFLVSIGIVLYVLVLYISVMIIPKKLKENLSKQYPEYNYS